MNIFELMEKHNYNFIEEVMRIQNKIEDNTYKYSATNYTFIKAVNQCIMDWKYNNVKSKNDCNKLSSRLN